MQTYQIEHNVPQSHRVAFDLPPNSPVGSAKITVLFPDAPQPPAVDTPRFTNIAEFTAWLETQPPSGRTSEEIDRQIQEERDSWGD
jgi:hypothetical protein